MAKKRMEFWLKTEGRKNLVNMSNQMIHIPKLNLMLLLFRLQSQKSWCLCVTIFILVANRVHSLAVVFAAVNNRPINGNALNVRSLFVISVLSTSNRTTMRMVLQE